MYCSKCGAQIDDSATFCPYCGTSTSGAAIRPEYYVPPVVSGGGAAPVKQTNGCAIAGFVLAFFMPFIGFILSIVGIVKAKKECGGSGKGLAIAGLIISLLSLILYVVLIVAIVLIGLS